MSNIISIKEIQDKQLSELAKQINEALSDKISEIAFNTVDIAAKYNLTTTELAALIGSGIGHYFIRNLLEKNIFAVNFEDYVKYCKELKDPLVKGFETYIDEYVTEIREARNSIKNTTD